MMFIRLVTNKLILKAICVDNKNLTQYLCYKRTILKYCRKLPLIYIVYRVFQIV